MILCYVALPARARIEILLESEVRLSPVVALPARARIEIDVFMDMLRMVHLSPSPRGRELK